MIGVALILARGGGWGRLVLVACCTAVVTALVLVAISLALLPPHPHEMLFELVADPGVRGGTAFAIILLTLPPVLLLDQTVRLGTAARERRLAALRVAGATPGQVQRLGAMEAGIPACAGSAAGIGLYGLLRVALGGTSTSSAGVHWDAGVRLVPTTVTPTWWQLLATVLGVTAIGVLTGLRASSRVVVSPLGVSRRQAPPPPRPWGLLLLALAPASLALGLANDLDSTVAGVVAVLLAVLGAVMLSPWAAFWAGRLAQTRVRSAPMLLAARRLVTDPRPAGRAGAAVGAIGLFSGGAAAVAADIVSMGSADSFYVVSLLLVAAGLFAALLVASWSLAVHSIEALLDRKRSVAALAAAGTTVKELQAAQRGEAMLVALPVALVGTLLGTLAMSGVGVAATGSWGGMLVIVINLVATPTLVWLAILAAARATRRWLVQAASANNLRTE